MTKQERIALSGLLKESQNVTHYLSFFVADHQGDDVGRCARGALRKLEAAIALAGG